MNKLATFSTDDLAVHERSKAWLSFVTTHLGRESEQEQHPDIDFAPAPNQEFKGFLEFGNIETLGINRVLSSASRFARMPDKGGAIQAPAMIIVQLRGRAYLHQDGINTQLSPGYWSILDTANPFSIEYAEQNEHLVLMQYMDGDWRGELGNIGQRCFGESGLTKTVQDLIVSTYREYPRMHASAAQATATSITNLLRVALEEAASQEPVPTVQRQKLKITNYIDNHLHLDNLGICEIAEALGYSVRQVHRLFHEHAGMTVSQYIWTRRINRSFEELRDAANDHRSITDIAFSWGFNSSAHFSRAFKEVYGISPRQCRARIHSAPDK